VKLVAYLFCISASVPALERKIVARDTTTTIPGPYISFDFLQLGIFSLKMIGCEIDDQQYLALNVESGASFPSKATSE